MIKIHYALLRTPFRGLGAVAFLLFTLSLFSQSYGDSGWRLDSALLDARFPAMAEWAKAGVEGGIPDAPSTKVILKITPKANLQKAIDKVALNGGVLLLQSGEYVINEPVRLRSGVILRGVSKELVVLSIQMHGYFWRTKNESRKGAILMHGIQQAGIENLTVKYTAANFEPNDRNSDTAAWEIDVFHKSETRDTTLFVESIWIHQARNCWVQDCNILWSGSDPIRITLSDHITCRRNFIDRCYNKNDGGMGYYNISNSRYVLICNEKVKRIRHLAIQNYSKYNVIIDNELEVDINFHDGDSGYNLVQGNKVVIPQWHSWEPLAVGVPMQHLPPGKGNILYNNSLLNKTGEFRFSEQNTAYEMHDDWKNPIARPLFQNVEMKTLYAVKWTTPTIFTLSNDLVQLSIDLQGGAIVDFHLKTTKINPFSWKVTKEQMPVNNRSGAVFQGHFLCTGRWGAPTDGEIAAGVPHNGQASRDTWKVLKSTKTSLTMQIKAPLDGVIITRNIELLPNEANFKVSETFQNYTSVARLFNVVQHATIGTPFLSEDCIVESNAREGFLQTNSYPNPHKQAYSWPFVKSTTGNDSIDLRRADTPESYVSTHVFKDSTGWVMAISPTHNLSLVYAWKTSEYPWINIWQQRVDGKLWAKGLEFGTTGIGRSYQDLLLHDTRFENQNSFVFLDAKQTLTKSFSCWLLKDTNKSDIIKNRITK